jgi:hypothetical protein
VAPKLRRLWVSGEAYEGKSTRKHSQFIAMAWQFGNDDNYFKMLPRELIQHISKFGIDTPLIVEITETMIHEVQDRDISFYPRIPFTEDVKALIWKYWSKISPVGQRCMIDNLLLKDETHADRSSAWCDKIKAMDPKIISKYGPQMIFHAIQTDEVDFIRGIFNVLKEVPLWRDDVIGQDIPITWLTVKYRQENMAKILIGEDLMPRTNGHNLTLDAYATLLQTDTFLRDTLLYVNKKN